MATYKKKQKIKTPKSEATSIEENSTTAEVFDTLDESASKSEEWVLSNQKSIFIFLGAVVIATLGYLGYQKYVAGPNEKEAANELAYPKKHFNEALNATGAEKDSLYTLAIEGAEGKYGFVDIVDNYSGTDAGNLAYYYAGISYLNIKDYAQAIDYLDNFSSEDELLTPIAKGAIGDAFANLNQPEDALNYYEQAAEARSNDFTRPLFLFKAANTALDLGDSEKALLFFEDIQKNYPNSDEAKNIEVYVNKAKYAAK